MLDPHFAALGQAGKQPAERKRLTREGVFRLHAIIAGEIMDQVKISKQDAMDLLRLLIERTTCFPHPGPLPLALLAGEGEAYLPW